ncbi:MAG: HAD family hydrolase [Anaerolineae bacterium]
MLACDYDGTIASDGVISLNAEQALIEVKRAGLLLGLVTGRRFENLLNVCPQIKLFDLVVAENGAVLHLPASGEVEDLAGSPPPRFMEELARRGVPSYIGRVIVGTPRIYEHEVLSVICELELELQVIFNRGSAMILPNGIDKAMGLKAGLKRIGITPGEVIGIGDAENDQAFLQVSGFQVAVANALDSVKADADLVTSRPNGEGIAEFVREHLLSGGRKCDENLLFLQR